LVVYLQLLFPFIEIIDSQFLCKLEIIDSQLLLLSPRLRYRLP